LAEKGDSLRSGHSKTRPSIKWEGKKESDAEKIPESRNAGSDGKVSALIIG